MDTEKEIRIIEQSSDEARLISKAMASSTASELLNALSDRPKTATELETETGYPLPTIQYHMGNLLKAGLVQVRQIRYSEKGKPMKLYAAADTILVISPKKKTEEDIKPVLRKYGFAASACILATAAASVVCGNILKTLPPKTPDTAGIMTMTANIAGGESAETAAVENTIVSPVLLSSEPSPAPLPEILSEIDAAVKTAEVQPVYDTFSYTADTFSSAGEATDILISQVNTGLLIFLITALFILLGFMIFEIVRIKRS